jgi:class 3 adenylate cyclase/predicted ATPase
MDIVVWLRSLGLEEYKEAFRDNKIDERVLPNLTQEDLKEIGVSPVGHRRILLDAIAALRTHGSGDTPPVAAAPAPPSATTPTVVPVAEAVGERRHVTVMFCDLVGSTSISAALDAEDWRDLVGAYLDAASAAVTEMGGHVAKKLGDGLMALFGYPVAQENDAERAARAALSIQRALAELNRKNAAVGKPALNARIGIETGPVVVDAAGEIYGDAPNTAARVQALAEPGTVVVTAQVQRQIAGLFVVEERGSHQLKGVPEPVTLFRLVRASGGGRRAGQRHLTPMVGREEEIAMLMRRWERARQGEGQLVLIVGEPGLGKSRLIEEFHGRLRDTPHTWAEFSCSQLLQNTPLHPIADWGRQRFGSADVPAEKRLVDLEKTLALVKLDPIENATLLAPLLDIPLPPDRALALPPEEMRRRQLAALTSWWMTGARAQPAVTAVEDLHWADPTTLELLRGIAERGALAPLFVLVTARPEFRAPWSVRSHHSTISLTPLDRDQVKHMVGELAARHALPKEVVEGVSERTGGVPLFVEEVTRLLLERGEQGGIQAIPPTLQQSLTARLDRLGQAREVAQIGAVIGRDFSYPIIRAVTEMENAALETALERLAEADIVLVQGLPPESEYRFKHALIQDAAYENLLKSRRQALHRRTGEVLRDQFATTAAAEPELLAHHFTQAGLTKVAIEWWGKAGQRSLERSANVEAAAHFARGLTLIQDLPQSEDCLRLEIQFQTAIGVTMMATKGWGAPEVLQAYSAAKILCERLGDPSELFTVLRGEGQYRMISGNLRAADELARQCMQLAENAADPAFILEAHHLFWSNCLHMGDYAAAEFHANEGIARYDPIEHHPLTYKYSGHDPGVCCRASSALLLWLRGYPDQAVNRCNQARTLADQVRHPLTMALAYRFLSYVHLLRREVEEGRRWAEKQVEISKKYALPLLLSEGEFELGWAFAEHGHVAQGIEQIRNGITRIRATGAGMELPFLLSVLAHAYLNSGELHEAAATLDEAVSLAAEARALHQFPELLRTKGKILFLQDPDHPEAAQACFQQAVTAAHEQGAKSLELRAATSLARLWRDQGKVQQAHELLAPVYGWFTEGFDTRDLKEAKALLVQLGA